MKKLIFLFLISSIFFSCNRHLGTSSFSGITQTDLFIDGENGVFDYRIPALTVTPKGNLIAVCDARIDRRGDLPNNIDLIMRRSMDNGTTWSKPRILVDYPGKEGAGDPCVLSDQVTGRIWIFFVYGREGVGINYSKPGFDPDSTQQLMAITSDDDGLNWSEPRNITRMVKDSSWAGVFYASGHGIQTKDGTLMLTLMVRKDQGTHKNDHAYAIYSNDHGESWKISEPAGILMGESKVVELNDGSIMINMRSKHKKGCRAVSISKDKGKTWAPFYHDTALIEPACNASIISMKYEKQDYLLFSNPSNSKKRVNMAVSVSPDQGKTWLNPKVIYPGKVAYSSMCILPDGSIGLFYERGEKTTDDRLTFARFSPKWLLN